MFTEALFTIAKTWKQPKCPLTDEWIKKMCVCVYIYAHIHTMECNYWISVITYIYIHTHIHTMEYYSAMKKNETMPSAATQVQLEIITPSQ